MIWVWFSVLAQNALAWLRGEKDPKEPRFFYLAQAVGYRAGKMETLAASGETVAEAEKALEDLLGADMEFHLVQFFPTEQRIAC